MQRRIGLLISGLAFLLLMAAVSTATALTPTTTSTIALPLIRIDSTPTATSTPPTFSDNFCNSNSGWPSGSDSFSTVGYLPCEYQIVVLQANYLIRIGHSYQAADFQAEVDAHAATGAAGSVGMYFGSVTNVGFYDFEVTNNQFALFHWDISNPNNTVITPLINPTSNSAILGGTSTNHLKVTRAGSVITLFANGTQLAQITNNTLGTGFVGLAATGFANNFDARFDNFLLVEAAPQNVRASGEATREKVAPLAARPAAWTSVAR